MFKKMEESDKQAFNEFVTIAKAGAAREERERCAKIIDERVKYFKTRHEQNIRHGVENMDGSWYRARHVEATEIAAALREAAK